MGLLSTQSDSNQTKEGENGEKQVEFAAPLPPNASLDDFAHLDQKAILRKVCFFLLGF